MRGFFTLAKTEFRLFMREPAAMFFTLVFPLMLLFVFGGVFGNEPQDWMDGMGSVDVSVPGYMGMIIGTTAIMSIPIIISEYRHKGIFRRLRATPIHPLAIIGAQTLIYLTLTALGFIILFIAGKLVYDLMTPQRPLMLVLVLLISFLCMASLGFLIGAYFKTPRTASVVANIVYFPQIFLAGAAMPREIFSDTLRKWTEWLPMTQVTNMIKAAWWGESLNPWNLVYLVGIGAVCMVISSRIFRWE
ncbi:MAG: ABC transporter permease [Thermomicrobiales bacterium]|nr:ABC transporter permease [Thermomicrobiales bacterium]MCO5219527.1 ABC transporter permease [Thermomicrobiales bacterium]MCO5224485.1 ABC transporter permease [Thermomicrobiales bacterium]MCO5228657.1 ABC transporter permease [Thermomicrobiales bacterium]